MPESLPIVADDVEELDEDEDEDEEDADDEPELEDSELLGELLLEPDELTLLELLDEVDELALELVLLAELDEPVSISTSSNEVISPIIYLLRIVTSFVLITLSL